MNLILVCNWFTLYDMQSELYQFSQKW